MSTPNTEAPIEPSALMSFHFDMGDSTRGPVGVCARVVARSRERALEILKASLPETIEISIETDHKLLKDDERVEYINVYMNGAAITTKDSNPGNDEIIG